MTTVQPQHSELRRDAWRPEWVIMAPGRAARPQPGLKRTFLDDAQDGPLAAGQEDLTPPEVYALRASGGKPNDATWRVRVVPNMYPALLVEHLPTQHAQGPCDAMGGTGAHEVIIEDPSRTQDLATLEPGRVAEVLDTWRVRLRDLSQDHRLQCGVIFRHRGADAGATLAHPHSQLLALPFVPTRVQDELRTVAQYGAVHGRCALCDALAHERAHKARWVSEVAGAAVLAPFASRAPYELLVAPDGHPAPFEDASPAVLLAVATSLRDALRRLDGVLTQPAYRLWLRTAPWRISPQERSGYHWHLSVAPVLHQTGAFEDAVGVNINTVLPEDAASVLRRA